MNQETHAMDPNARAYAAMDEANAAHLKGEETADERRLRDAREGKPEEAPRAKPRQPKAAPLQVESPHDPAHPMRQPYPSLPAKEPKRGRKKPTHDDLVDTAAAAIRKRKLTVIETPEVAITIWKSVRVYGSPPDEPIGPASLGKRSPAEGASVSEQVVQTVEECEGFAEWRAMLPGAERAFMANLGLLFPQEYAHPWRGLCGAERDAIGAEARALLASKAMDEAKGH